jgi:hypothetical protein
MRKSSFFILLFLLVLNTGQAEQAMHPQRQIDNVKQQIEQQKEPCYAAYTQLIGYADSILKVSHHALTDFAVPGYYDKPREHRENSLALQRDAFGAYCSALAYCLSGDQKYGEKACYFLNAWSFINKKYSGHDGVLVMAYSGSALLMAAELMSGSEVWGREDENEFRKWVAAIYSNAVNEIRTHKNNWADWGRFGSLLAASFLGDQKEIEENVRLIKSDLFEKIAADGSMPEETKRGGNGIWYTYFSLTPLTASCWLVYNLTGENLFTLERDGISIKKALDYLFYYNQHPDEWAWNSEVRTGKDEIWPDNLFEAMAGIYNDEKYREFATNSRPIIYPIHHFAWVFPTLMPVNIFSN